MEHDYCCSGIDSEVASVAFKMLLLQKGFIGSALHGRDVVSHPETNKQPEVSDGETLTSTVQVSWASLQSSVMWNPL
jgi:hypothetical protein